MAKASSAQGVWSGKAGSKVYAPNKGDRKNPQIIREYQGNVYNPKSKGQTDQRGKLALTAQLNSMVTPALLVPFGGRGRYNRSKFTSNNMLMAEIYNDEVALSFENMKWSASRNIPFQADASLSASVSNGLSGVIDLSGAKKGDGVRVIALVAFKTANSAMGFDSVSYGDFVKTTDSNRLTVQVPLSISQVALQSQVAVACWIVPFVLDETAQSVRYGNLAAAIEGEGDHVQGVAAEIIRMASQGTAVTWGGTIMVDDDMAVQQNPSPVPPQPAGSPVFLSFSELPNGGTEILTVNDEEVKLDDVVEVDKGSTVHITVTPADGFIFDHAEDASTGFVISTTTDFEFTANNDLQISLVFND